MGRRKPITLIELFLGISIIALFGSVVLVRTKPMLDHYRFNHGFSKLKKEIAMSRRLSKIVNSDIELCISQNKKGLVCIRTTDEPLKLARTFDLTITIPYLQMKEEYISLIFTATGWIKEEKKIAVHYNHKSETINIKNS